MTTNQPNLLRFFRTAAVGGTLLLHLGCGGDEGSASAVESGLPPDKTLVTLTDAEAQQLCAATADAADEIYSLELRKEVGCTLAGATLSVVLRPDGSFGIDRTSCERARDQCLADGEWTEGTATQTCELHPMRNTTGTACTASVEEYESCVGAFLQASADAFASLDCATLAAQRMTSLPSMSKPTANLHVPECAAFEAKCGMPSVPSL